MNNIARPQRSWAHLPAANLLSGAPKSTCLYSTNLAASEGNDHMVHEALGARSPSWRPDLIE